MSDSREGWLLSRGSPAGRGLAFAYWCQPRAEELRQQRNNVGQLRFCLVRDVAALFAVE